MDKKRAEFNRHALKNRVRGLRAVRTMRPEAQAGFDDLWTSDIKVYCYPDYSSGHMDVPLDPGYGVIKLRDDDRYDLELNGKIVKTDCRYDELESFLADYSPKKTGEGSECE